MPSNYVGVPTAVETPAAAPGYGVAVTVALPIDAEPANASSVAQPFKVLADWVAWARDKLFTLRGIYAWLSTVTYNAGNVAIDNDQHVYRALSTNGNMQPSSNPSIWSRIDWSAAEVEAMSVIVHETAAPNITATNGAIVASVLMSSYSADTVRRIEFNVFPISPNSSTIVDLSACVTARFQSYVRTGQASMTTGTEGYGGAVGINIGVDGNPNRVRVWYKAPGAAGAAVVGVSLLGV
jgi:hypothetical protein